MSILSAQCLNRWFPVVLFITGTACLPLSAAPEQASVRASLSEANYRLLSRSGAEWVFEPTYRQAQPEPATYSISLSTGIERLNYQETEPDSRTFSEAEVTNYVTRFNAAQEYDSILLGLKGTIPYSAGDDTEKWDYAAIKPYQLNTLEYKLTRIDGYLGYRFDEDVFSGPGVWYGGLRYSNARQNRYDFYIQGNYQTSIGKVIERIESYSLLVGYKGGSDITANNEDQPILKVNYHLEYGLPIYNKVTNSRIPEITFHRAIGYTAEGGLAFDYFINQTVSLNLGLFGGRIFWAGSNWENTSSGQAKWPENKTIYSGASLGLAVTF